MGAKATYGNEALDRGGDGEDGEAEDECGVHIEGD